MIKNKRLLSGILFSIPLLAIAANVYASSTVFDIPSAADLVTYAIDFGGPLLASLWKIIGALVGIGVVFYLIDKITGRFH